MEYHDVAHILDVDHKKGVLPPNCYGTVMMAAGATVWVKQSLMVLPLLVFVISVGLCVCVLLVFIFLNVNVRL